MTDRQHKREQFQDQPSKRNMRLIPVAILILILAGIGGWLTLGSKTTNGHKTVAAEKNGTLHFKTTEFNDGKARFYRYQGQSGSIDFFLVLSQDGVIRAAFDTCDVCYKERKGYRQEGAYMVCNNCDQRFRTDLVNEVKGGCNPAPLRREQIGQEIVIKIDDIERGSGYFTAALN